MTGSQPLVSVIIPAYNAEKFLRVTLASVCGQSHENLEILVVNDGSTDRTATLAESVAGEDKRVRVIHQKNGGVAAARNRALREARGEYVASLDADDVWHSENIAHQLIALRAAEPSAAVAYCRYLIIDDHGNFLALGPRTRFSAKETVQSALIDDNFIGNGSSTLIRRIAICEVDGYDESMRGRGAEGCEDWALHLALAERWDFVVVPRFLVAYRSHSNSMSKVNPHKMERSRRLMRTRIDCSRANPSGFLFGRSTVYLDEATVVSALKSKHWKAVWSTLGRLFLHSKADFIRLTGWRLPRRFVNYLLLRVVARLLTPWPFWIDKSVKRGSNPTCKFGPSYVAAEAVAE